MPGAVWLKTKKLKATFTAGTPSQHQPVDAMPQQVIQPAPVPALSTQGAQPGGGTCQPCQLDCTKPNDGEPHTCINEHGCKGHWRSQCPKAGQWGNHLTNGHDKWLKLFLEHKEKQKQKAAQDLQGQTPATAANNNQGSVNQDKSTPGSMHCGAAIVTLSSLFQMFCCTHVTFNDSSDDESM